MIKSCVELVIRRSSRLPLQWVGSVINELYKVVIIKYVKSQSDNEIEQLADIDCQLASGKLKSLMIMTPLCSTRMP